MTNQKNNEWDELRTLLVGQEKVDVDRLVEFLENPSYMEERIAEILPQVINLINKNGQTSLEQFAKALQPSVEKAILASTNDDPRTLSEALHSILPNSINLSREKSQELSEQLAESLTPFVEKAVKNSTQMNIKPLSEGLYPVIGPAIRKAVATAFKKINQTLNQNLNQTISISAFKWRFQAFTSGKPFLDIVARNTLDYQVTQLFLIHRETGLLLQHIEAPNIASRDADLVSAMLKAIQDFVTDSFSIKKNEELSTIEVGDHTIWIEQGPQIILAGVVFGNAPLDLREKFIKTLEQIHLDFFKELADFNGDTEPFESNPQYLKNCLLKQEKQGTQKISKAKWIIVAIILAIAGYFGGDRYREFDRWSSYIDQLETVPGIILIDEGRKNGRFFVKGLRTRDSLNPITMLDDHQFNQQDVNSAWTFFQFLSPEMILSRAKKTLSPPDTISLTLKDATLIFKGIASKDWLDQAQKTIKSIWEISEIDFSEVQIKTVKAPISLRMLTQLKKEIEDSVFYFPVSIFALSKVQQRKAKMVAENISLFAKYCTEHDIKFSIIIKGVADSQGKKELNERYGRQRAEALYNLLVENGVNKDDLSIRSFIEAFQDRTSSQSNRRANLEITYINQ